MSKYDEFPSNILHGPLVTTVVTVSGGPTLLPADPLKERKDLLVYNPGPDDIFVGGSDVTDTNGVPVVAGGGLSLSAGRIEVYATVSGSNQFVRVMEAT